MGSYPGRDVSCLTPPHSRHQSVTQGAQLLPWRHCAWAQSNEFAKSVPFPFTPECGGSLSEASGFPGLLPPMQASGRKGPEEGACHQAPGLAHKPALPPEFSRLSRRLCSAPVPTACRPALLGSSLTQVPYSDEQPEAHGDEYPPQNTAAIRVCSQLLKQAPPHFCGPCTKSGPKAQPQCAVRLCASQGHRGLQTRALLYSLVGSEDRMHTCPRVSLPTCYQVASRPQVLTDHDLGPVANRDLG